MVYIVDTTVLRTCSESITVYFGWDKSTNCATAAIFSSVLFAGNNIRFRTSIVLHITGAPVIKVMPTGPLIQCNVSLRERANQRYRTCH